MTRQILTALLVALLSAGCAHLTVYVARVCTEGGLSYRKGGCE